MCNRLLAAAHLIAHAEWIGQAAWIGSLKKYNAYFEGLPESGYYLHQPRQKRPWAHVRPFVSLLRSGSFPMTALSYRNPVALSRERALLTLLLGWRFRDSESLRLYGDHVRCLFTPRASYRTQIDAFLQPLRAKYALLVGVHIRRADYATYLDGAYYFDDACYCRWMAQIQQEVKGTVGFVLASDERLQGEAFKGLNTYQAPGHELIDLYALAGCDYILGPPSTYTAWASFYGDRPLLHLEKAMDHVELAKFIKNV